MSAAKHTPWLSVTAMMRAEAAGMDAANAAGQRANGDSARLRSDADEIDRRCNSHDALVEALESLCEETDSLIVCENKPDKPPCSKCKQDARKALEKARAALVAAKMQP